MCHRQDGQTTTLAFHPASAPPKKPKPVYGRAQFPASFPFRSMATHHFVGVIAVVFHAVFHQLLLVQVPRSTVGTHKCGPVWDIAGKDSRNLEGSPRRTAPVWCLPMLPFKRKPLWTAWLTRDSFKTIG